MRTIFVGDVHGCADELDALLVKVGFTSTDRLMLTGDMFDRGEKPLGVLKLIRLTNAEAVIGNHEDKLLRALAFKPGKGKKRPRLTAPYADCLKKIAPEREAFFAYLKSLPMTISEGRNGQAWTLLHAGIDLKKGLLATNPAFFLYARTHPPMDVPGAPEWFKCYDGKDGLLISGHVPLEKPFRAVRKGKPVAVAVDTGCCFGRELTAYILEEDRFVSVRARKVYYRP
ncbi:MAG: hypothetical protein HGB19_01790 [Chlorobiales bacterium]|jgi:hypothetical protein|nr:hypothetical protein [Chlorobiales bacterium]